MDTLNIVGIKRNCKRKNKSISNNNQRFRNGAGSQGTQLSLLYMLQQSKQKDTNFKANKLNKSNSSADILGLSKFLTGGKIDQYFLDRISKISAKHRELLFETLEEFQRNKTMNFTCIFPSAGSCLYDHYFEQSRTSNQLLHKYLFTKNDLYQLSKQISDFQKKEESSNENSEEEEEKE